ncbi:MAG TPA: phosphatase PAP2 family protein [Gammaproteobacteria bacterium]|nr:phosphatase PAP2 family protein [Gammaproteobacteria bacterium]
MDATTYPQLAWLIEWINQYPSLTGLFIFTVAFLESMVLIGVPIPGAVLIISFGALIALGHLDFTSTLLLCIAGAIAGDGLSFWIGYRFHQQIKNIWPFKYFKAQFKTGEKFFRKHGGKSIVFGRFVGPMRAIIPTIAGMMRMSPLRFTIINVLSAILWAPAYLLPGMVFGASLELASEVAIRLVVLVFALIIALLVIRWLINHIIAFLQPRAEQLALKTLQWARQHRRLGPLVQALIDPRQPESPALLLFAIILILSGLTFFITLNTLAVFSDTDRQVYELLQGLRTPWVDQFMVLVTMLADNLLVIVITIVFLVWFLAQKNIPAALHWISAIVFGAILTRILKVGLHVPRPDPSLFPDTAFYSFPSGHSTMSMVMYGFLAIIIGREVSNKKRIHIYVSAGIVITLIALSRLYLGAHWLSDVIGGLTLGLIWITLLGIAYRQHPSAPLPAKSLAIFTSLALVISTGMHWQFNYQSELARYTIKQEKSSIRLGNWENHDWQTLPEYRHDLNATSTYPFNVQWNGQLGTIKKMLASKGWKPAPRLTTSGVMKWLSSQTPIYERPILPHAHNGAHETLIMTFYDKVNRQFLAIRFWPSGHTWKNLPVWLGQAAPMQIKSFLNIFYYPVTKRDFNTATHVLKTQLTNVNVMAVTREINSAGKNNWNSKVLLIHAPYVHEATLQPYL